MAKPALSAEETQLPADVTAFLSKNPNPKPEDPTLEEIKTDAVPALQSLASDSALIETLRGLNAKRLTLTAQEIDAMEQAWQHAVESRDRPKMNAVLHTPATDALRTALQNQSLAEARLYVSDNRGLLTAATTPTETFELGDWGGWRRIYMSSPKTAFIEAMDKGGKTRLYRVEIGIWDPAHHEAIGTLIAEIPEKRENRTAEKAEMPSAPPETGDEFDLSRP